jgi:hypothetical protein
MQKKITSKFIRTTTSNLDPIRHAGSIAPLQGHQYVKAPVEINCFHFPPFHRICRPRVAICSWGIIETVSFSAAPFVRSRERRSYN